MRYSNWQNKASVIWFIMVIVVAIIMAVMWFKKEIHIQSNIFKLLPALSQNQQLLQSHEQVSGKINQQVFLMLQSSQRDVLNRATQDVVQDVQHSDLWQPIEQQQNIEQFSQQLFHYRTGLLSQQTQQLLEQNNEDAVLEQSMLQMVSPSLPLSEQLLHDDPLLLFPQYLMEKGQNQHIQLEQGFPTVEQEQNNQTVYSCLMILNLTQSPYNIDYQQQSQQWLDDLQQKLQQHDVKMIWTGTLAFASYGTQSAQQEISTIGLGSSIGVVLLVLFGFRSLRPMFTEFIAVSVGSLMALAITHWLFGEIHLMTLVFGASLIGASVDFSFYFMAMQSQQRYKNGFEILTPLLPSLFLGLMTTIIGYLFLAITPFPAFKQIAVFSAVGLASAWVTSILLLPRLPALNAEPARQSLQWISRVRQYFMAMRYRRYALMFIIIAVSAVGLTHIQFNDDIHNLQSTDKTLLANDQTIRQLFGQQGASEYLLISAETPQQVNQLEAELIQKLTALQQSKQLQWFQAMGLWFNPVIQQHNIQLLQAIPVDKLRLYAQNMGLDVQAVLQWQQQLHQQPIMSFTQFQTHPLAQLALSPTQRIILLQGIHDRQAIQKLQNSSVYFMQPAYSLSEQFAEHRKLAQWLLGGAILSIAILIWILYGLKSVLPMMLPVNLALALTFALQGLMGVELNLFSIMGCFLILGIGVDYAIFYCHEQQSDDVVVMALFLCMMSTLLGFGLLSLSHTYAIFCFGLTVLCGVIFSYIFATCLTPTDKQERQIHEQHSTN